MIPNHIGNNRPLKRGYLEAVTNLSEISCENPKSTQLKPYEDAPLSENSQNF